MATIKNYKSRLSNLESRRTDKVLSKAVLSEAFSQTTLPETVRYVYEAMSAIDPAYTANTYAEAQRVTNQINKHLEPGISVTYDYQGSVPLGIHIRLHSDLDILTIITKFYTLQHPQIPQWPYVGDPVADLRQLRRNIHITLSSNFPQAKVDDSKGKAISICEGSLTRRFDLIVANWYNTNDYAASGLRKDRGLYLYDKIQDDRFEDFPFSHMAAVEAKVSTTWDDNYRRIIRLLKNLKMDASPIIDLSSFMITSVLYHMADIEFRVAYNNSTRLLVNTRRHLAKVIDDAAYRRSLYSPNGREKLFGTAENENLQHLRRLLVELDDTITDLAEELKYSSKFFSFGAPIFKSSDAVLNEAIVNYNK